MSVSASKKEQPARLGFGDQTTVTTDPSPRNQPLIKIRPSHSWLKLDVAELYAYRELLYFLIWRDLKVRYKQTALGAAWAILQPLLTMVIFTLFFGKLGGIESQTDGIPYPVFVYAGLALWTFFANAVTNSGNSLVGNSHLLTKIYFPRVFIPAAAIGAGLVDLAIAFVFLIVLMLIYGVALTWTIVFLPLFALLTAVLALGVGMWLSALNVTYRDVKYALPFIVQLWMFVSPIIYPATFVPQKWRWVLSVNPLTGIITAFRATVFGRGNPEWMLLGISVAVTVVVMIYAVHVFSRMEESFADVV